MTGSVEDAKGDGKAEAADIEAKAPGPVSAGPAPAKASPDDLLKKAVAGKAGSEKDRVGTGDVKAGAAAAPPRGIDARLAVAATVALVLGTGFGLMAAPRERSGDALARIETGVETARADAVRRDAEIERLSKALAALRDTADATRGEVRSLAPGLTDRLTRLEQNVDRKIAALSDKIAQPDHAAAAPAPVEKRVPAPVAALPTTSPAIAASTPKSEPTQTGTIADTKPKPETIEAWALREVYDGVAMLEDRKRRLVEVAPGDSVPGVGRVESIERRGRAWVVVTKQGLIAPQTW